MPVTPWISQWLGLPWSALAAAAALTASGLAAPLCIPLHTPAYPYIPLHSPASPNNPCTTLLPPACCMVCLGLFQISIEWFCMLVPINGQDGMSEHQISYLSAYLQGHTFGKAGTEIKYDLLQHSENVYPHIPVPSNCHK